MKPVVLDENVLHVADGRNDAATTACVEASIERLIKLRQSEQLVMDDGDVIFDRYYALREFDPPYGIAMEFLLWVFVQRGSDRILDVSIHLDGTGEDSFVEFPDDLELTGFDHDDRKWVAVAIASGLHPPIVSATDSDWRDFEVPLSRYVRLEILCRP